MLLFRRELIPLILEGKKTQTRRPWEVPRVRVGSVHEVKASMFSKPAARVRVIGMWKERLGDISEEDARAEGCSSREEFIKLWRSIYGTWQEDLEVWVVEFRKLSDPSSSS